MLARRGIRLVPLEAREIAPTPESPKPKVVLRPPPPRPRPIAVRYDEPDAMEAHPNCRCVMVGQPPPASLGGVEIGSVMSFTDSSHGGLRRFSAVVELMTDDMGQVDSVRQHVERAIARGEHCDFVPVPGAEVASALVTKYAIEQRFDGTVRIVTDLVVMPKVVPK